MRRRSANSRATQGLPLDFHGYTVREAIAAFVEAYNRQVQQKTRRSLRVVHGYGSTGTGGEIRSALRALLEQNRGKLTYTKGDLVEGNPGLTIVHPKSKLAPEDIPAKYRSRGVSRKTSALQAEILAYCAGAPRGEEKIIGKFRQHSIPSVKQALKSLVKQEQLKIVQKKAVKCYQAASGSDN